MTDDTPTMRAADNDREAVVEHLARAQAEGRLDLAEFDERVRLVWVAQTYADLAVLIADLPDGQVQASPPPPTYQHQVVYQPEPREVAESGKAARFFFRAWVAASMINFVIWGLVSITNLELVYPWWIWVAGPWGALILAGRMTRFGLRG
ncbi:DUF1707 domain-containing protein [Umezawaea sp. NPDC059074]|uniref:DUF1707 SHOCT-like domain-containing protein n=1 Tax=Umezawaea sp. NPDC059074 TaxID=3346716 RepID=UPI0036B6C123